jgi:hypothetical protein
MAAGTKDYLQDGVPGISLDKWYGKAKYGVRQHHSCCYRHPNRFESMKIYKGKFGLTNEIQIMV